MRVMLLTLFLGLMVHAQAQQPSSMQQSDVAYRQSQYEMAEEGYRTALQKDATNSDAAFNLGNALYRQKKYKESLTYFEVASKNGSPQQRARAHYNQGVVYSRQKDLERSIAAYKATLRLTPDDTQARENLQKALRELKRQQQEQRSQPKPQPARYSQQEAEQRLRQLQEKEKQLQQKLNRQQRGSSMEKDW